MKYWQLWFLAYRNPSRFADVLSSASAPRWGFYAAFQRGLMDGFLTYLPVYLLGKVPPMPSYLAFIPTEKYY